VIRLKKENWLCNIGVSVLFLLFGSFILCCPILNIDNITTIYRLFLGTLAFLQVLKFAILYKQKDYTNFFAFLISIILCIGSFIWDFTGTPRILALTLLIWILVIALVKLKKADYYNDRKSKVWCMEVALLLMFLLTGVLTCLNFAYESKTQIIVLGYFIFISGIFEVVESLLLYLTKGKLK